MNDRRGFLTKLVGAGAALIGAGLAGVAGLASVPKAQDQAKRWRKAVSMFDLGNKPMMVVLAERHQDGWYETRQQTVVYIDKDESGAGYRALSATCTHLGCGVAWDDAKSQFVCPCHAGTFDRSGKVVSGPPPRPMDRFETRLNDKTGDIEVQL